MARHKVLVVTAAKPRVTAIGTTPTHTFIHIYEQDNDNTNAEQNQAQ
jgi:hypothetical protein